MSQQPRDSLRDLIDKAIALKDGDREFMLYHHHDCTWSAEIGNPSRHVLLGEERGEVRSAFHNSPEAAVAEVVAYLSGAK